MQAAEVGRLGFGLLVAGSRPRDRVQSIVRQFFCQRKTKVGVTYPGKKNPRPVNMHSFGPGRAAEVMGCEPAARYKATAGAKKRGQRAACHDRCWPGYPGSTVGIRMGKEQQAAATARPCSARPLPGIFMPDTLLITSSRGKFRPLIAPHRCGPRACTGMVVIGPRCRSGRISCC